MISKLQFKSEKERGELVAHLSKKRRLSPKGEPVISKRRVCSCK
jgi:hypothetical protein